CRRSVERRALFCQRARRRRDYGDSMPHGHPDLDVDLRAQSAWLRRLAGALTRDDAAAADAAQEAWLARLGGAPAPATRGWLRVVLRNVIRKSARTEGRRQARERTAGPAMSEALPTPEELALRMEAQRQAAELVRKLDEPFKSTLLLRYYEGL